MRQGHTAGSPSRQNPEEEDRQPQERRTLILRELDHILASKFFQKSPRGRQFLSYIVMCRLDNRVEELKERVIGVKVFQRQPGYATGDDPVVRVQASDVRRRLQQYYQADAGASHIRIDLPVGTYCPAFEPSPGEAAPVPAAPPTESPARPAHQFSLLWAAAGLSVLLIVLTGLLSRGHIAQPRQQSVLQQFWAPVFRTQQPVLICLVRPVGYRPDARLYEQYAATHPGTFQNEDQRWNNPLRLNRNQRISWGDIDIVNGGVEDGDVYAAIKFASVFVRLGKASQVRIGEDISYEDLRDAPAVVIGAFDNRWTMQLTSGLRFAFVEEKGETFIREQIQGGRSWHYQPATAQHPEKDYAIVGRLIDSKTGQFDIIAGGITSNGTETAGEFASSLDNLRQGLRSAPVDWSSGNSLFVLETTITDEIAGPPHVVASYFW